MKKKKWWLLFWLLIPLTIGMKSYAQKHPYFVDTYYSKKVYLGISKAFGMVTRIFPFSIGQVLLIILVIVIVGLFVVNTIKAIKEKKISELLPFIKTFSIAFSILYFLYFIMLGANYYNYRIMETEDFSFEEVTNEALALMLHDYIEQVNQYAEIISADNYVLPDYEEIFEQALNGYQHMPEAYSYMDGNFSIVKPFIFSDIQVKMGYSGMYFFFTAEPLVNSLLPMVSVPYATCHEMAHQRGIAREGDANYIAIIACINNEDPYFRYSGYYHCVRYIGRELYKRDESLYFSEIENLNPYVVSDINGVAHFWLTNQDEGLAEKADKVVEANLKSNDQEQGLLSYNEVAEYLIVDYFSQKDITD
jgi:hypothetical protein